jgi:hypothetical protein
MMRMVVYAPIVVDDDGETEYYFVARENDITAEHFEWLEYVHQHDQDREEDESVTVCRTFLTAGIMGIDPSIAKHFSSEEVRANDEFKRVFKLVACGRDGDPVYPDQVPGRMTAKPGETIVRTFAHRFSADTWDFVE